VVCSRRMLLWDYLLVGHRIQEGFALSDRHRLTGLLIGLLLIPSWQRAPSLVPLAATNAPEREKDACDDHDPTGGAARDRAGPCLAGMHDRDG
jgi:hypothetical protein